MNLFDRSVASITAPLAKMVARLEQHITDKRDEVTKHNEAAAKISTQRELALGEITTAQNVADKIKGLLA